MRSSVVAGVVVLVSPAAHADEPTELHDSAGLTREPAGPQLHLDLDTPLRAFAEGYDADVQRERVQFDLGSHTRASLDASAWTSPLFSGEGWGTGVRLERDVGPFVLAAELSYNRVDSAQVHGAYRVVGLSLRRTFKLSKWMTAWIALTAGRRTWLGSGPPPPGEANDTAVMLSIGTTFR